MILGMSTATYTFLHVLISLAGIGSGFIVMFGFVTGKRLDNWNAVFLTTTALTSITGFGFPFDHLLPSHILGILSLVILAVILTAIHLPVEAIAIVAGVDRFMDMGRTTVNVFGNTVAALLLNRFGGKGIAESEMAMAEKA